VYKKRWYDGLNDIYEGKDEFEIKFGCFGGDGGGGSSSAQDPNDVQNAPSKSKADDMPSTGFRGEQSAGSPSNQGYSGPTGVGIGPGSTGTPSGSPSNQGYSGPTGVGIGPGSTGTPSGNQTAGMSSEQAQANQNIAENIATAISANQAINNPANQSISDNFTAIASAPTSSVSQNVSAVSNAPSSVTGLSGLSGFSNYSGLNTGVPTGLNIGTPTSTQDVIAQATDINSGIPGISIGPGTLTGNISPAEKSVSLGYSIPFARGGAVNQGIGSVFPYPRRR